MDSLYKRIAAHHAFGAALEATPSELAAELREMADAGIPRDQETIYRMAADYLEDPHFDIPRHMTLLTERLRERGRPEAQTALNWSSVVGDASRLAIHIQPTRVDWKIVRGPTFEQVLRAAYAYIASLPPHYPYTPEAFAREFDMALLAERDAEAAS